MRNKVAKAIRKQAKLQTIGKTEKETRDSYKRVKRFYKLLKSKGRTNFNNALKTM